MISKLIMGPLDHPRMSNHKNFTVQMSSYRHEGGGIETFKLDSDSAWTRTKIVRGATSLRKLAFGVKLGPNKNSKQIRHNTYHKFDIK